ncbi:cytosine permease [Pseudomonas aeruginosa]|uniref:cytosine permease n=1 Tax=Pseudomonas aeruginosa TaxID=287 RepID=UPI003EDFA29A
MSADSNYSQQPVPLAARKSALALSVVMLGLTFFSASMWTGGTLGTGLSYDDFFLAVLLGNLMLGLYTAILGFIGARTGLSTHLLAHYSFGSKGSWLPSALLGGTQVGWFGVGVAMFAIPVAKATGLDVNLLILVSGARRSSTLLSACGPGDLLVGSPDAGGLAALMTLTVFFGIAGLTLLSAIAVPAIVVLGSYSVWLAVRDAGGLAALQQVTPSAPLSLSTAIALVVGSFVSAGTLTADFVRFGRSARTAVVVCLVAFFLGNSLMFIFGAAGAAAVGKSDISDVMIAQGLLIPAILVLGLNIWTTNDNALYASGLGFANITGLSSRFLAMLNGALGTLAALWLYNHFVGWLTFLSAAIPPIGGVIIADYLSRRRRYRQHPCADIQAINWAAILAVACGTAAGHWLPGIVPVNAVLGAAIAYLLLNPLLSRSPNKPEEVLHAD